MSFVFAGFALFAVNKLKRTADGKRSTVVRLNDMKAVVVIPARYGSTRLPGKVLLKETGKFLMQHVWERVREARLIDEVIIATDDERVAEAAQVFGATAVMTSCEHQTGTDRIAEVAAGIDADIIINVQGDEPDIEPGMIDQLVGMLSEAEAPMATLAAPIGSDEELRDPNVVKVVLDKEGFALYFSRARIPYVRDRGVPGGQGGSPGVEEKPADVEREASSRDRGEAGVERGASAGDPELSSGDREASGAECEASSVDREPSAVERGASAGDAELSSGDREASSVEHEASSVERGQGICNRGQATASRESATFLRHIGIYGYKRAFLLKYPRLARGPLEELEKLEQLRALENGYKIKVGLTQYVPAGVDTREQYEAFKRRYEASRP